MVVIREDELYENRVMVRSGIFHGGLVGTNMLGILAISASCFVSERYILLISSISNHE
jgi:hypothetical protein